MRSKPYGPSTLTWKYGTGFYFDAVRTRDPQCMASRSAKTSLHSYFPSLPPPQVGGLPDCGPYTML